MDRQEIEAFQTVFGKQPPELTIILRANEDVPGVPLVIREPTHEEWMEIQKVGGKYHPDQALKDTVILDETLRRVIVSVNGRALPDDLDERKKIIGAWREAVMIPITEAWVDWWCSLKGQEQFIRGHPNSYGANIGPVFAPRVLGPDER